MSAAFVEPLLRIPCTQRRSVERGMPYSALICDDGLPFPLRLHDLPLELLLVMTGTIRIGMMINSFVVMSRMNQSNTL